MRKDSPLIIGRSENGNFIASDVPAILKYTKNVCYISDMEIAELTKDTITFYDVDRGGPGKRVQDRGVGCEIRRKRRF